MLKKYFRIQINGLNPWIESLETIGIFFSEGWVNESMVGEKLTIEAIEMDEYEFNQLKEFTGP